MPRVFEELPFAYVIWATHRDQVCHFCCSRKSTLHRCARCKFAYYCDRNCQKLAWKDHEHECKNLKKISPVWPTDMTRLIARIIFKLRSEPEENECGPSGKRTFGMLLSHVEEIMGDQERMQHFSLIYKVLEAYIGNKFMPSATACLEIYGKIVINSFNMKDDEEGTSFGISLYLQLSALNHSCNPDAVVLWEGRKAILNVIKDMDSLEHVDWEQLHISYTDVSFPTADRQQDLKEKYYFDCTCSACLDESKDQMKLALACTVAKCQGAVPISTKEGTGKCDLCHRVMQDIQPGLKMMEHLKNETEELKTLLLDKKFSVVYERATKTIKDMERILHPLNVYFNRLLDFPLNVIIQQSVHTEEQKAWIRSMQTWIVRGYKLHFHSNSPTITEQLYRLANVMHYMGDVKQGRAYFQQTFEAAKISHGENHKFTKMVEKLLQCYSVG